MGNKQPTGDQNYPNLPNNYEEKEGAMYYKSGWGEFTTKGGFMGKQNVKAWLWVQCIHWVIYLYPEHQGWYNWGSTTGPSEEDQKGLSLPSIPGLPSMPGIPSLSMPSMPDVSMPDVSMPSVSAPSLSAPSVGMPSMGSLKGMKIPKKTRKKNNYPWTRFEIYQDGVTVEKSGKTITIKGAEVKEYWEEGDDEAKKDVVFNAVTDEQADSWIKSFESGGAKAV